VCSHAGRGVFDGTTGDRIARDASVDGDWHDDDVPDAEGIGPLAGQRIRLAGLWGGALASATSDGWSLAREPLALVGPGGAAGQLLIDDDDDPRAAGFSPSGRTLVVATASTLMLFGRP
jgi:hypothetical protein